MLINSAFAESDTISVKGTTQEQQVAPSANKEASGEINWMGMMPMVLIFVIFYFLLIRPQEKKRKDQEAMIATVKRGEEILTTSGIFGVVTRVTDGDNTVELEIAQDINIKILKSAIVDIISRKVANKTQEAKVDSKDTKKNNKKKDTK
jgi:preprotein translocase subunit YajC